MRVHSRRVAALGLGLVLFASAAALAAPPQATTAAAARPINRRMEITRPGSYVLNANVVVGAGETGIVILADDVDVDLAGYTISGPGGPGTMGIDVRGASNVTVRNGSLVGLGVGVALNDTVNAAVEGLMIHGADAGGAPPNVEVGVLLVNSRGVAVAGNIITDVFLGVFVRGGGSGGNRVADNTITGGDNGQLGVCYNPAPTGGAAGPAGDLVYNNLISRFNVGIQVSEGSHDNIFVENFIAFFDSDVEETTPGSNEIADNRSTQL